MFHIEWTPHQLKSQHEIDEVFAELQESIEIDGPTDFTVLVSAAQLLETDYVLAKGHGFGRVLTLDYADIVDLFESMDAALEALEARRTGIIEFYCGPGSEWPVFESDADDVRLFLVPWLEAAGIDLSQPLPEQVKTYPSTVIGHAQLIDHFGELRHSFACSVVAHDPRLGQYEPIRRWSRTGVSDER